MVTSYNSHHPDTLAESVFSQHSGGIANFGILASVRDGILLRELFAMVAPGLLLAGSQETHRRIGQPPEIPCARPHSSPARSVSSVRVTHII